jgi:mannosyltransferase
MFDRAKLLNGPDRSAGRARFALCLSRRELGAIVVLTAIALVLRTTSLSRSLFNDESYSLALSQRSIGEMVKLFGYEANGTLYSIVLWPLVRLFGTGVELVRLPSVLAGAASVPALWWCARQFGGRRVAWIAAGLLAVNPMAVWYSQEARAYSFAVLAACLAFGALARAVSTTSETGREAAAGTTRRGAWVAYVVAMAALAYCDLFAAPLALPAQALIARRAGPAALRAWLRSLLALLVLCLPLLVFASISRSRRNALYWLPKTDRALVELALQEFSGGFANVNAVGWLSVLAGLVLVAVALLRGRGTALARDHSAMVIAAAWGLLPTVALLAVSFVEPVFWPRYAILSLPGLCLLAGLAADRAWGSSRAIVTAGACIAALAALALFADARQRGEIQQNWQPVGAWLREARLPGEPTIVDSAQVLPSLGYYDPDLKAANGELIVQEWRDLPLPAGLVGFKDRTGYGSVPNGPPSAATIAALAQRGAGTVWLIVSEVDNQFQRDPRKGAAMEWARMHCRVQVRESIGVWAMRASACAR